MDPIDPGFAKQVAPGLIGSGAAILFIRGPWLQRIGMVIPGAALSYYGADWLAEAVRMPLGLAGFLMGLFGMAAVAKVFDTWQTLQLGPMLQRRIAKWLGVEGDA